MSTASRPSNLFEEIATLFASAPSVDVILAFRPSESSINRAAELLELNRSGRLDDLTRDELNQFEQAELLMRLVKARARVNQQKDLHSSEFGESTSN